MQAVRTNEEASKHLSHLLGIVLLCLIPGTNALAGPNVMDEPDDKPDVESETARQDQAPKAAKQGKKREAVSLETVVTASRFEEKSFESKRSVDFVDKEEILDKQARTVPEVLSDTPGVFMQSTNRGAGSPILRGMIGPQNLILVDGLRFNTSIFRTGPNQYLAVFDPFALRRIEVVKGPSSVLYGNGAVGGVVNLLTSRPVFQGPGFSIGGTMLTGAASADRSSVAALETRTSYDKVAALAGITGAWFGSLASGGGSRQPISDYQAYAARAKVAYSITRDLQVSGAYLGTRVDNAGRADNLGKGDIRFYDNLDHFSYLTLKWDGGGLFKGARVDLMYHRMSEHIDRYSCAKDQDGVVLDRTACTSLVQDQLTKIRKYDDSVDVFGGRAYTGLELWQKRIFVQAGIEAYHELVASERKDAKHDNGFVFEEKDRGNFSDGSTYTTAGAYLFGDIGLWNIDDTFGTLHASGGVRLSYFGASAPDVPGIGDVSYEHYSVVGNAGMQLLNPGRFNLYASFIQGFRAPNLQEATVLGDTGTFFEVPNKDLGPEKSNTFEVGIKLRVGPLDLKAAYYYSMLDDFISRRFTVWQGQSEVEGKQVVERVNANQGRFTGVEGALGFSWQGLSLLGSVTWTRGDVETEDQGWQPARRVPPLFGLVSARYDWHSYDLYAELFVNWAGSQDRLNPGDEKDQRICQVSPYSGTLQESCEGTPGWATFNLRVGWSPVEQARLELAFLNISDENYRLHGSGYDAPGFDVRATASIDF